MATIPGTPNPETLPGTDNDDTITGLGGNDRLEGGGGNDLLDGGTGTDTLLGGSGNDTYVVDVLADVVDESVASNGSGYDGVNLALLAAGIYTLPFGVEWARVMSTNLGLLIQLIGNALDNQLYGNGGNNSLSGLPGNDYLEGGAGNDTLLGGDGDDGHQGGTGNDSIVGGAGWDFVFFDTATAPVTVNLLAGTASGADIGTDTLSGLEGLAGGAGADTLTGDNNDNEIQGRAGNDSIDGGNGFDSVSYIHAAGPVLVDMAAGTASGADGNDSFVNIEWVKGSSHGDTLIGNGAGNTLEERGGSDSLDGAGGFDTVSYWGAAAAVNANLLTGRATTGADTDTLVGIEALSGFTFNDTLVGDGNNNRLEGRDGNDSLVGNDGDDTLIGGAGNDTLDGGNHLANSFDWADYSQAPGPMVINLQTGVATGDGTDTLSNIEAVVGSRFDDSLVGANVSLTYFRMGAGNDTIVGNGPSDIIDYSDAPNGVTIVGGASGAGTVTGHGTDVYSGIENLFGSNHGDSMVGSSLGEGFRVRNGADTVDGLGGNDRIDYRSTGNVVNVSLETGIGLGADGNDVIRNVEHLSGSDVNGTDTLVGSAGANAIDGRIGDDSIVGGGGDDSLRGGPGNDTLVGGTQTNFDFADYGGTTTPIVANLATGVGTGDGTDTLIDLEGVIGGTGNDALTGNDATLNWFWPGLGDDTVHGAGGDDVIAFDNQSAAITLTFTSPGTGTATGMGTDTFTGVERAVGGNGNDTLTGSAGDEVLRGGPGNDSLNGAGGTDWADYFSATSGVTVDLATNRASGGHGDDTLAGFENISGSNTAADDLLGNAGANWIVARGGNDWLVGEGGADTLDGGAGNDWIGYPNASGPVTVNLGAGTVSGADGSDSLLGIEGVYGSAFNDSLVGGSALTADEFDGQAGNDTIDGGAVTDRANYANLNRLWFKDATQGVVVDLGGITGDGSSGQGTAQDGSGGTDVLRNINFVTGTSFDDSMVGSSAQIFEFFEGGAGDDTLDGGVITDTLTYRNGNRANYANASGPVQVDLAAGTATGADGDDTLLNMSQVQGSRHADTLLGSAGSIPEHFRPGAGADSVDGRGGEDWIRYDEGFATQGVSLTLRADAGQMVATDQFGSVDTLSGIEHVRGSSLADSLTGSARTDLIERFQGGPGNDTIDGAGGLDWVTYADASTGVSATLGGSANDGLGGTDTLRNIEQLRGSLYNDTLAGSNAATLEALDGYEGNDTLDGQGGPDQADYFHAWASGAVVDLTAGTAVQDGFGGSDTLLNIEHVRGARDFGDTLSGNAAANSLEGSGGDDLLDGRAGNDMLSGGTGNDTLVGGAGIDTLNGGSGNDVYEIDVTTDVLQEAVGEGTDTVRLALLSGTYLLPATVGVVENASVVSAGAVNVTGNAGPNELRGGSGNNSLAGGAGDDTLAAGTGNDTVDGGADADTLQLPGVLSAYSLVEINATDLRLVGGGGGENITARGIESFAFNDVTLTLAQVLALAGNSTAESIVGTENADLLDGAGGNDTLIGLGGNDTLVGGTGTDSMVGGLGDDLYSVDAVADVVVEDPGAGTDTVNVALAASSTSPYVLGANIERGRITSATAVATHLSGNALDNELIGNDGANSLNGGDGNDTLIGGLGNDTMAGGAADDVYILNVATDVVNETAPGSGGVDTALLTFGAAGSATLAGGVEHATITNATAVNVTGNDLNNRLTGGDGANNLAGLGGDDTLAGGKGNDTLAGGAGFDTADYAGASSGVNVNLVTGTASGGAGADQLSGIEQVIGSALDDTLAGSGADETFVPGAGNDRVDGGGSAFGLFDTVDYRAASGPLLINLQTQSASGGGIGNDTLVGIGQVFGGSFADSITGSNDGPDDGMEAFVGGAGNDTVVGGTTGLVARYLQGPVTADLAAGIATSPGEGTDTLQQVGVWGSPLGDSLSGANTQDDLFIGDAGNDTLRGLGGDDTLIPGPGSDLVDGGGGNDFVRFFFETAAINANLSTGVATSGGDTDTLVGIENLGGTGFGDTLVGNDSPNWVDAEPGNDLVQGLGGNDSLGGQDGDDTLEGGDGNDRVIGDVGNDSLLGGTGTDEMHGSAGNDTLRGEDDNDSLNGQQGNDLLDGGNGSDQLRGDADNDTLLGGEGDDYLTGGTGNDRIDGGAGFDTVDYFYSDTNGPITVNLAAATATATGSQGTDTLFGIESVNAGDYNDTVVGDGVDNWLMGNGGDDSLAAGPGRDFLDGGTGNDTLRGDAGVDQLAVGAGNDDLDGGALEVLTVVFNEGNSLWMRGAPGGVTLNLSGVTGDGSTGSGTLLDPWGGTDVVRNVSVVFGSNHGDHITLSSALLYERVSTGRGNDTIDGGAITDTLNFRNTNFLTWANAQNPLTVDLRDGVATNGAETDVISNINGAGGGTFNDTLRGSDSDIEEYFSGGAGADLIDGRGGADFLQLLFTSTPVTLNLAAGTLQEGGWTDTLLGIEGIRSGSGDDLLLGGLAANGTARTDTSQFERFDGYVGNDTIDGGQGFDMADYASNTAGALVTLADTADGSATDGWGTTDVLRNIEGVRGSDYGDTLNGSDTAPLEVFNGRGGSDRIDGKGGVDQADYRNSPLAVNANLASGTASDGWGGTDTLSGIEQLRGSRDGNDTLTGDTGSNTLQGLGGNDSLVGGDGDDLLDGGSGNNTVDGGNGNDTLVLLGDLESYSLSRPVAGTLVLVNPGTQEVITVRNVETLRFADGDRSLASVETLAASTGNDTLEGTSNDDLIDGLAGNDSISGRSGNDTLIGGAGIDTLEGDEGDDLFVVDVAGDVVREDAGEGIDRIHVAFATSVAAPYVLPAQVENATVTSGPAVAVHLTGNDLANVLVGNAAINSLVGGLGNDTLDGGLGNDNLNGGPGDDVYVLSAATDVIVEPVDATLSGIDRVHLDLALAPTAAYVLPTAIENARVLGGFNVNVNGNAASNQIEGNDGRNSLTGLGGDDWLQGGGGNDTLDGGEGDDALDGGTGDDLLVGGPGLFDYAAYIGAAGPVSVNLLTGRATGDAGSDTLSGIEGVQGSLYDDTLTGDDGDNTIIDAGGNNTIVGGAGSDYIDVSESTGSQRIDAGPGNDLVFTGAGGNDSLVGGDNFDIVYYDSAPGAVVVNLAAGTASGAGNDTLVGMEGVRGSPQADTLIGSDGDNDMQGGAGADSIVGGNGIDLLRFTIETAGVNVSLLTQRAITSTGTDTVTGIENLRGTSFPDTLIGDNGPNWIRGGPTNTQANGPDSLVGNGGDDTLAGEGWTDTLVGGTGNDRYEIYGGEPVIELPGEGTDTVVLVTTHFASVAWLDANVEHGVVSPGTSAFTLTLSGNAGSNSLSGSAFGEVLNGGDGEDTLLGGGGNDTLDGGNHGFNTFDVVDYRNAPGPMSIGLATINATTGQATGDGTDTLLNLEAVYGSSFNDSITIGAPLSLAFIRPGAGNDTITGNGSFDILDYADAGGPLVFTGGATPRSGTVTGSLGTDVYAGIEGLFGGPFGDSFTGTSGDETMRPRGGDDTVDGGGGSDRIDYRDAGAAVVVDLAAGTASGGDGNDVLSNFERVRGSANFGDTLGGDAGPNHLDGLGGNDSLSGGDGDDTLLGSTGNDTLVGGNQVFFDWADYSASTAAVTVNLTTGTASGDGNDTLSQIEGVIGSPQNDLITGSGASLETFRPGAGNDTVNGGGGDDLLRFDGSGSSAVSVVFTAPGTGTASGQGNDVFTGIEAIVGSSGNDTVVGSSGEELLRGNAGNDSLDGGAGGGDRADYRSAAAGVVVSLLTNRASGGDGDDTLAGIENINGSFSHGDTLTGDAGGNDIDGMGGNDSVAGEAGNDTLHAGSGVDTVDGGADTDTLVLLSTQAGYSFSRPNSTDLRVVNAVTGEDVTVRNVELFQFTDLTRTLDDILGSTPSTQGDSLTGTSGDDTLDGLAGNDTMTGLAGDDTYRVDALGDVVVELPGEGFDTVLLGLTAAATYPTPANVEVVQLPAGTLAIHVDGNADANGLIGNAGANRLRGLAGNDTLDGGLGNDTLVGGTGDDVYVLNVPTDVVDETADGGAGTDTVRLNFTATGVYTLPAAVERGTATGAAGAAIGITGNAQANVLQGHAGNNSLAGGLGNDTFSGSLGNDTVVGGDGIDLLDLPGSQADWSIVRPNATDAVFSSAGAFMLVQTVEAVSFGGGVPVSMATLLSTIGSPGNDTLIGGAGNELLAGGAGADVLSGGEGDDSLRGDAGNDTLAGGPGTDMLDGGDGSDVYAVGVDAGLDVIEQNDAVSANVDAIVLAAGIAASDLSFARGFASWDDLVVTLNTSAGTQQVVVVDFYRGDALNPGTVDQLRLATGQVFTATQMAAAANAFDGGGHVFLGAGNNDTIGGDQLGVSADWMNGSGGNDSLSGLGDDDSLLGGNGNDTLLGGAGGDRVVGGAGADVLDGGSGNDTLVGGAGADRYLFGLGGGSDVIAEALARAGIDAALDSGLGPVYEPGDGDLPRNGETDVLQLGAGILPSQLLPARSGNDLLLQVASTSDQLRVQDYFASGVPVIERIQFANGTAWSAANVRAMLLQSTSGNDTIVGYSGPDNIGGGAGNDVLDGREGSDTLSGGAGADTLSGGSGSDRFVFGADAAGAIDTITDFVPGVDRIGLSKAAFAALAALPTGSLLDPDASAFVDYNPATGALSYDADGAGAGAAVIVALLGVATHPAALGADIVVLP